MMNSIKAKFDLTGRVAIVTGASKGIGEAMARGLAEHGASVVVSSRKQDAVDAVAAAYKENGWEATGIACHMGDLDQIQSLVDKTIARYGGIDIVINNAAANPAFGPSNNVEEAAFDKIMDINVKGPFELAKRAYPSMSARGNGSVINISSVGGISPEQGIGIYSVSKAALINLSKMQAKEWATEGVRVNAIAPGFIKTKFSAALWQNEHIMAHLNQEIPMSRIADPDEVAGLAVFLASDASSYCTGGVYMVDGGLTV